jgi:hypothetical protein
MQCKFEEKHYEQQLNKELAGKRPVYSPGQVEENTVAIDAAFLSTNLRFWRLWNKRKGIKWMSGLQLEPELWDIVEEIWDNDMFPKFKCNLFIQHKRPEYIRSGRGNEYKHWNQPYFRYYLTEHQQEILYKLEQKAAASALVVYACPAFCKRSDLWRYFKGKLVENSNFVQPHAVHGHRGYTFVRGGKKGYPCSEHVEVEGIDILKEIDKMLEKPSEFKSNVKFVHALAREIRATVDELNEPTLTEFREIEEAIGDTEQPLGRSVLTVFAFNLFANTTWGIIYEIKTPVTSVDDSRSRMKAFIDSL